MKLEHIALNLPDPRAAASWYAEQFGLKIIKADTTAPFVHFLSDEGGSLLEVYSNAGGAVPDYAAQSPFTLHLAFSVDDLEATRDQLLQNGATPAGEPQDTPAGDRLLFLRDPWGVALQLVKRNKPLG